MVIVNNTSNGNVALWLCGGGTAVQLGQTVASGGGTIGPTGTGYRWINDTGATANFSFALTRTRTYQ